MEEQTVYELVAEREDSQEITLLSKKHEYGDVYTFEFKPSKDFEFKAGQFGHFLVHNFDLNKGKAVRDFSFANTQEENILLSMHVRKGSEYKRLMSELKEGDTMTMFKIKGNFVLPENVEKPIVLIAGGIGITPCRSLLLSSKGADVSLVHVSDGDFLYEEELKEQPFIQERVSSLEINKTLRRLAREKKDGLFYIAGPPGFVRTIRKELITLGIPIMNLRQDSFEGYENL